MEAIREYVNWCINKYRVSPDVKVELFDIKSASHCGGWIDLQISYDGHYMVIRKLNPKLTILTKEQIRSTIRRWWKSFA